MKFTLQKNTLMQIDLNGLCHSYREQETVSSIQIQTYVIVGQKDLEPLFFSTAILFLNRE